MIKELQWIKDRAKLTVNNCENDSILRVYRFVGNLPHRMINTIKRAGYENFGVHNESYCIKNTQSYMLQIHVERTKKQYGGKYIVSFHEAID